MRSKAAMRLGVIALLLGALGTLAVARAQPAGPEVRVFNAGVDVPVVDVLIEGDRLFPDIHAGEITSFRRIDLQGGSSATVRVTLPGDATRELLVTSIDFGSDARSTLALSGPSSALRIVRVPDEAPLADRSDRRGHLRLVHAAHDAPAVDLIAGGEPAPLIEGVAYPDASEFVRIDGGYYDLELGSAAGETLRSLPNTYLAQYVATTIFLYGSHAGGALSTIVVTSSAVRTPDPNVTPDRTNTPSTGSTAPPSRTPPPGRTRVPGRTATPTPTPNTGTTTGRAPVRVLHAASQTGDIDVTLDGAPIAEALGFASAGDYGWQRSGAHRLEVALAGASAGSALLRVNISLPQGYGTIVLVDEANRLAARIVADGDQPADRRMGSMRFVHAAPDVPRADVALATGMPLASGAEFFEVGRYVSVTAAKHDAFVSRSADGAHIAFAAAFEIAATRSYSCYLVGRESERNVSAIVLEDAVTPSGSPPVGPGGEAALRFVHAMPRQGSVDLLVGGLPAEADVAYRRVGDYQRFTGGSYTVRLTKAEDRDSLLADEELVLAGATSNSLIAVGSEPDIGFVSLSDDLSRPEVGQARVRFAHVSRDAPALDVSLSSGAGLAADLAFKTASDYVALPGGFESFAIRYAEGGGVALDVPDVWLKPGGVYTVFVMGVDADSALEAVVARDAEYDDGAMRVLGVALMPVAHR